MTVSDIQESRTRKDQSVRIAEMRYLLARIVYFERERGEKFEMSLKDAEDYLRSEG